MFKGCDVGAYVAFVVNGCVGTYIFFFIITFVLGLIVTGIVFVESCSLFAVAEETCKPHCSLINCLHSLA